MFAWCLCVLVVNSSSTKTPRHQGTTSWNLYVCLVPLCLSGQLRQDTKTQRNNELERRCLLGAFVPWWSTPAPPRHQNTKEQRVRTSMFAWCLCVLVVNSSSTKTPKHKGTTSWNLHVCLVPLCLGGEEPVQRPCSSRWMSKGGKPAFRIFACVPGRL
jgi:hypothetical protein